MSLPRTACRLIPLAILLASTLPACKGDAGPSGSTPAASGSVASGAGGDVDFPSYPATSANGVLWLESQGGPLGKQIYQAKPTEVGFSDYFYSQSDSDGRKGDPVVYTITLGDLAKGTHDLQPGQLKFYVGDGTNTNDRYFQVTGKIRVDANDTGSKELRVVVVGTATEETSKEASPVKLAIVLKG